MVTVVLSFIDSTFPSFLFLFLQLTGTIHGTGGNAQPGSYKVSLCLGIVTYFGVNDNWLWSGRMAGRFQEC